MMTLSPRLEEHRIREGEYASLTGDLYGAFCLPGPCGEQLLAIAAGGEDNLAEGWEHVSVSTRRRIPNWREMCFVKDLFWPPQDCVVQFHPPKSDYVNIHPNVLHLWRPRDGVFPMPPRILV